MSEEFELGIFDRPSRQTVREDWTAVSYPDSLLAEIPTNIASELLTKIDRADCSPGLQNWLGYLAGDVNNALAQVAFPFGDPA